MEKRQYLELQEEHDIQDQSPQVLLQKKSQSNIICRARVSMYYSCTITCQQSLTIVGTLLYSCSALKLVQYNDQVLYQD